jgi:hypothetical protein
LAVLRALGDIDVQRPAVRQHDPARIADDGVEQVDLDLDLEIGALGRRAAAKTAEATGTARPGASSANRSASWIAGSVVLFLIGLKMIFGELHQAGDASAPEADHDPAVFPLAIPSIAGPGTMLTVVLASVAAATARNRTVGVLRILGMSNRQLRGIQAWELAPVALTAVLVGTALGLVLPIIVTSVLDLRPFVGGDLQPGPVIDPLWVLAAVGAFVVIVVLAGIVAAALGRRFAPAGTLKMGEG